MSHPRKPSNGEHASESSEARTPRRRRAAKPPGPPGVRTSAPPFAPPTSSPFPHRRTYTPEDPTRRALKRYGIPAAAVVMTLGMAWAVFTLDRAQPGTGLSPELEARIERWEENREGVPSPSYETSPSYASPTSGGRTGLSVVSFPTDAVVQIEFEPVGVTPLLEHTLEAGNYFVSLTKVGYAPLDTLLFIDPGEVKSLYVSLRPAVDERVATLPAQPSERARVDRPMAERRPAPQTPPQPSVAAQSPPPSTSLPSAVETSRQEQEVAESVPEAVDPTPEPVRRLDAARPAPPVLDSGPPAPADPPTLMAFGVLGIGSEPQGATVYLNGQRAGETPLTLRNLELGDHEVTMETEGYRAHREMVRVVPDQRTEVYATLAVSTGVLSVRVQPWGSVFVDNVMHRQNVDVEVQISLPVGPHTLRVEHPSLGSVTREVTVREGNLERVVIDMNRQ